jgi:prophage tail gpP-like protein
LAELGEQRLTVEIESTGERWDKIQSYRLTSNYLTPTDEFEFTAYNHDDPATLRRIFRPLMRVKLYIDGELQVIGRIDKTSGTGGSKSALIVRGRDYMAELVDGGADPSVLFTAGQDLGDALMSLWKVFGIRTLVGDYNLTRNILTGRQPFTGTPTRTFKEAKLEEFKVRAGDGAWQAGDRLVARHGFMIRPGGARGTVCIVEPLFGQEPLYDLVRGGNVMDATADRDYADAPTVTIATGRVKAKKKSNIDASLFGRTAGVGNDAQPNDNQLLPALVQFPSLGDLAPNEIGKFDEVKRIALEPVSLLRSARVDWKASKMPFEPDDDVLYRPMYYEDPHSRTDEQLERGVRRELSRRLKSCLTYNCTVRGHRELTSGAVYSIDTMANVKDEIEDVNQRMWVMERTLFNDGQGPKTSMALILPGSIAL